MQPLTVCILTYNSMRTLEPCLLAAMLVADEMVVVDSGSSDGTLAFLSGSGVQPIQHRYETHARQMNFAIAQATYDWVFCLDSDETLDPECIGAIRRLKADLGDPTVGHRIQRHWHVLGRPVRAVYPVSSPDRPVRLFHRGHARFNDQPVDDKVVGFARKETIPGKVAHSTFFSVDEVFSKLNSYTARLVDHTAVPPSLARALISPPVAFLKWYFRKGAYRDGAVGVVTATYAALYTFLKYFRAWCKAQNLP
jgi:glycosyltransferase involved in cell wall biosynthesis